MSSSKHLAIIGCGKMGEAILTGWLHSEEGPAGAMTAQTVVAAEPGAERQSYLGSTYGIECVESAALLPMADIVVLAVKPQVMSNALGQLAENENYADGATAPLYVSIAAGVTTSSIEERLPEGSCVVRVMPNMPLAIGAGASGVCGGACATEEQVALVAELFGSLGRAVVVDETDMDAVCALSGSGPAYVAALIEAMRDAAVKEGLEASLAEALALQTVLGTAQYIQQTGTSVGKTRESICSPGGTTLAALDAMYGAGFNEVVEAGISAAVVRSKELAQCS